MKFKKLLNRHEQQILYAHTPIDLHHQQSFILHKEHCRKLHIPYQYIDCHAAFDPAHRCLVIDLKQLENKVNTV